MNPEELPAAPDALLEAATPVALLAAWEAAATSAQVATQLPHQPAILAWLTTFWQRQSTTPLPAISVDWDDVQTVLRGAGHLRTAKAEASGAGRAKAAQQLLHEALAPPPGNPPASRCLLSIEAAPAAELEMDELSELLELLQSQTLGDDCEMIFGHGYQTALPSGAVQAALLVAYAA